MTGGGKIVVGGLRQSRTQVNNDGGAVLIWELEREAVR